MKCQSSTSQHVNDQSHETNETPTIFLSAMQDSFQLGPGGTGRHSGTLPTASGAHQGQYTELRQASHLAVSYTHQPAAHVRLANLQVIFMVSGMRIYAHL